MKLRKQKCTIAVNICGVQTHEPARKRAAVLKKKKTSRCAGGRRSLLVRVFNADKGEASGRGSVRSHM